MKKVLLALLIGFTLNSFAQEATEKTGIDYNNEGNEFVRNKDYKSAYSSYLKAIELFNADESTIDDNLTYNTGYCAFKSKKYDEAIPYFEKSLTDGYKAAKPYIYLTQVYMKKKDLENMEKYVLAGLEKYETDKSLNKLAGVCYQKQGLVFYKEGNKIKKAANESGLNETDADKFNAEYAKADEKFKEALPLMEKAYTYDSKSKNTLKVLQNVYTSLKMTEKADDAKVKLESL